MEVYILLFEIWLGYKFEDLNVNLANYLKRNHTKDVDHHYYRYSNIPLGVGYCITTYMSDGDPLPSFQGEPILLPLNGNADEIADTYWNELDKDNRISLGLRFNNIVKIINKY